MEWSSALTQTTISSLDVIKLYKLEFMQFKTNTEPSFPQECCSCTAFQFACTLKQESAILLGRRLPTNMAGICYWPGKRKVAPNSCNQANKRGASFPPSVLSSYVKLSAHYFVAKEWFEMEKQADNFTVKHMQSKQKLPGVIRGQEPPDLPWLHTGLAGRERSEAMRRCHHSIIHSPCRFPLVRSLTVTKTINDASLAT